MDKLPLAIEQIRELLPHRYPMRLVDRVLELTGTDVVAEKLVSANEPENGGRGTALLSVKAVRFRRPVVPGDMM